MKLSTIPSALRGTVFHFLKVPLVLLLLGFSNTSVFGQSYPLSSAKEQALVNFLDTKNQPFDKRSAVVDTLLKHYHSLNDSCNASLMYIKGAANFDGMLKLDSAVLYIQEAEKHFNSTCDSAIWFMRKLEQASIHLSLDEYEYALKYCDDALECMKSPEMYSDEFLKLLNNRAISMANLGDLAGAEQTFIEISEYSLTVGEMEEYQESLANLATLAAMNHDYDKANLLYNKQIASSKHTNDSANLINAYFNLSTIAFNIGEYEKSASYNDSAMYVASQLTDLDNQVFLLNERASILYYMGEIDSAYTTLMTYNMLNDSLHSLEKVRAIEEYQEKYESEKKTIQIQDLKIQNLDSLLSEQKAKQSRNISYLVGGGILLAAFGLFNRLNFVRRSRAALQAEKDVSEGLLLNILPEKVAQELKDKGYADAKEFTDATILFTDFKGFTMMSEQMTASELVQELDICFKAFDQIMQRYNIEKIKTIGDAYMAVGGIHDPVNCSPADVVHAGLDMQEFITKRKAERQAQGLSAFDMRVGINYGLVVAGIVGMNKFQYDIWGDSVNIAARMESSGEVGRVNISETVYEKVKAKDDFHFEYRGEIKAKNKGMMKMYFVHRT